MFVPTAAPKDRQQLSDQEVISRYIKDEGEQWINELYRRYIHLIFGTCMKYTADREVSKEISLVVFEKMLKQLPLHSHKTFRNFNVWLFVLVKNTCISYLRKKRTDRNRRDALVDQQQRDEKYLENEGFLRLLDEGAFDRQPEKLANLLQEALKQLSDKQRRCVELFFYEKLSYKEIRQETKMELSAIKSALQNGKRKLRLFLQTKLKSA